MQPKRLYTLLSGESLELDLGAKDRAFLDELVRDADAGAPFHDLLMRVKGPGSYPLDGGAQITRDVMSSPLYRVAVDVVNRAGIAQGKVAPPR